jgi:hypothetical protein
MVYANLIESDRARRELSDECHSNEFSVASFRLDTAENESLKVGQEVDQG